MTGDGFIYRGVLGWQRMREASGLDRIGWPAVVQLDPFPMLLGKLIEQDDGASARLV